MSNDTEPHGLQMEHIETTTCDSRNASSESLLHGITQRDRRKPSISNSTEFSSYTHRDVKDHQDTSCSPSPKLGAERSSSPAPSDHSVSSQSLDIEHSKKTTREKARKPGQTSASLRYLLRVWRWEMITWLLGTAGFLANIILISLWKDKLQSRWEPNIQITTFVAALAQLSQSALLVPIASCIAQLKWQWVSRRERPASDIDIFDIASRGPDGSLRLLWHFAWKQRLASLGALSTILLLGFPAFVQQAVQIDVQNFPHAGGEYAQVQRATQYNASHQSTFYRDDGMGRNSWFSVSGDVDLYLKSALEAGLLASKVTPSNVTGLCARQTCSWDEYRTLAICSHVNDAEPMLVFPNNTTAPEFPPYVPLGREEFREGVKSPYQIAKDSNFHVQARFFAADKTDAKDAGQAAARILQARPTPNNTATGLADLAHIYISYYDPCLNVDGALTNYDPAAWKAHRASFNLCIQTHNTSYNSSGMHIDVLRTEDKMAWTTETPIYFQVVDPNLDVKSSKYCAQVSDSDDKFCMSRRSVRLIGGQLASTLDISARWGAPRNLVYSQWAPDLARDILGLDPAVCSNNTIRGKDGFERRMTNIAASLSNALRTAGSSVNVNGTAYEIEATIQVNYVWLVAPGLLYIIISVFFFATVMQTSNIPPWKTSALALLWCRNPRDDRLATVDEMKRRGGQVSVLLEDTGDTWQLTEKPYHPR
ncbi:hypothetical protein FB567DRAFT_541918 [Paraphoma chrysanthemicola]|uniref:Uncharacterized protein n=1 Tax=Paraphoma chrysanthemicola TaxID=798071 RepID=A0A8K0QTH4_9PLEO|nr:hypothetical protein FB567DRAFT_541918 [Paraphoma chrysanthemicola]